MKKLVFNIAILICVIFTSCSDDDSVNIVSLNTFGTKFCRNDVVKVFVSAELSDDTDVSYEWGCDGGSMTNPQGLFENVWKAPNEAGTYEIWCTNKGTNGAVKLTSTKADGRFARSWNNVSVPFSTQVDYAVNACPSDNNFAEIRIEFARINNATFYVTKACFTTYPKTGAWKATYTTTNVTTGETTDITIDEGTDTANFKFKKDAFKTIAVSIDANKKFIVYYDGKKYFESSALASVQEQYYVSRSGFGLDNKVIIFADNLFVFDNGTICTAEPRER